MNLSKKSQIFIFDLIISVVVLIVSLGIAFSYFTTTTENENIFELNNQILNSITQTEINSLNNQDIRDLFIQRKIKNYHNTIAQQISEFYVTSEYGLARNLTSAFIGSYVKQNLNFEVTLINSTGGNFILYQSINPRSNITTAKLKSTSQRVVYGFINSTHYYPHKYKIEIWV